MRSVLIVEDDAALLRALKDNFDTRGYAVSMARDGESGLRAALANPPDLTLLDIMLPGLNGFEICRKIRAHGLEMPILMLTAKDQEADIVRGLELGADDYVTKPFSIRELMARAAALLRRQSAASEFGDCRLDAAARKLFKRQKEVPLTTKEFRLLQFFLTKAGRALTRDQILDGVWGEDLIVNDRSVDRCVTTLRAKIGAAHIQTIRDIGYRFEVDP